jgi:phosphohistidine phosphatase
VDLYLVRHAIADDRHPERWADDSQRPLTEEGVAKFRSAARGLRRIAPEVDVVLASPYVRAWDTAVLLHEETGWPEPVACPELEADKRLAGAIAVLERERERCSLALVGHEPFLSGLASLLICGDENALAVDFKKGGVMALDVEHGRGILRWKATPKLLRALDR